jgi:hypothetical protein
VQFAAFQNQTVTNPSGIAPAGTALWRHRKRRNVMRYTTRFLLMAVLLFTYRGAYAAEDYTAPGVGLTAGDPAGGGLKPLEKLEVGDSLAVGVSGATPRATIELRLEDSRGRQWSYSRVHSDARGGVPQTLFWYQSGVIGTTARRIEHKPDPAFLTFDEAERFFADNTLRLTVRETSGRLLAIRTLRLNPRRSAFIYPSNANGILENAINVRDEQLYVTGQNFPAGAAVQLFLVPNRFGWAVGEDAAARRERDALHHAPRQPQHRRCRLVRHRGPRQHRHHAGRSGG